MDAADATAPIRFGTSGWRGVLGEDFTFPRLRGVLHAVARHFEAEGGGAVVVGYDNRFLGQEMAELAACILTDHGLQPALGDVALPTPAVVRAVRRRRARGAVMLTASHNPPEYQGLKVFDDRGSCIDDATARRVEARIRSAPVTPPQAAPPRPVGSLRRAYVRELLKQLRGADFSGSRLRVTYDAMHGTGAGVLDEALVALGLRVDVLRGDGDPRFGGDAPDPCPGRLRELSQTLRARRGLCLGLATDGDADRFAAVDADGRVLSETESLALLVDHLAREGRIRRGVAISLATGSLVERVAAFHGLPVRRHPIGFKHLSRALLSGQADVAGEESGGFATARFGPDKDGILAGCLLAEMVATTGQALGVRLDALVRRHGASVCGRIAVPAEARSRKRLSRLLGAPPRRVAGAAVRGTSLADGLHLALEDGFLMLRGSGTEPLLRVYAEAPGPRRLRRRLAAGAALLGSSGFSQGDE